MNIYQNALSIIKHKDMSKAEKLKRVDAEFYKPAAEAINNAKPSEMAYTAELVKQTRAIDDLVINL